MKPFWFPKLKSEKEKTTEPPTLSQLACMAAVGGLLLISMASAMLAVSAARPKKSVVLRADATQLNAQQKQQNALDVESKPGILAPLTRSTSGYPSSIITQGVVLTDPPGGVDQTPPLTTEPTLRGLGAESDARDQRLSATRSHSEAASPNRKKRRRRSDSPFAAISRALGFRIVRWLNKL